MKFTRSQLRRLVIEASTYEAEYTSAYPEMIYQQFMASINKYVEGQPTQAKIFLRSVVSEMFKYAGTSPEKLRDELNAGSATSDDLKEIPKKLKEKFKIWYYEKKAIQRTELPRLYDLYKVKDKTGTERDSDHLKAAFGAWDKAIPGIGDFATDPGDPRFRLPPLGQTSGKEVTLSSVLKAIKKIIQPISIKNPQQRAEKRAFMTQSNQEMFKGWLYIHYVGAFSMKQDEDSIDELKKFLRKAVGKRSKDELSAVGYPPSKQNYLGDSLARRGSLGVIIGGTLTSAYETDAGTTSSSSWPAIRPGGWYSTKEYGQGSGAVKRLEDGPRSRVDDPLYEPKSLGKEWAGYNEITVDNWQPTGVIARWDDEIFTQDYADSYADDYKDKKMPYEDVLKSLDEVLVAIGDLSIFDQSFKKISAADFKNKLYLFAREKIFPALSKLAPHASPPLSESRMILTKRELRRLIMEAIGNRKRVVAIYPGRFQPMGRHHKAAYDWMVSQFGPENSFIATSDKVCLPKSPLCFDDKASVARAYGIPEDKIVMERSPYIPKNILSRFNPENTSAVFIVGKKDMDENPRFKPGMTKSGRPTYFQHHVPGGNMEGFNKHGYLIQAPHQEIDISGQEMSGTRLREFIPSSTPEQFKDVMGFTDPAVMDMLKRKIGRNRT